MTRMRLLSVVLFALVMGTGLAAVPKESRSAVCASTSQIVAGIESDSGIGGTGLAESEGGIGGTGLDNPDRGPDSGIGGTGIFGTITGFASVCINGLEVHYDSDVPITENGQGASVTDLAVGQVVWIVASGRGGSLVARSISMLSALIGKVEQVDSKSGRFRVNGEEVEVLPSTLVLQETGRAIEVGLRVDVSGLRRPDGLVVASRVDLAGAKPPRTSMPSVETLRRKAPGLRYLSIEGFAVTRLGSDRFDLDGVEVQIETSAKLPRGTGTGTGLRVTVEGPLYEKVLRAGRMTVDRSVPERPEPVPILDPRPDPRVLRFEPPQRIERPQRFEPPPRIERPKVAPRPVRPIRPLGSSLKR